MTIEFGVRSLSSARYAIGKMKPVIDILEERISAVMAAATGRSDCAAIVRPSTDPKFGDYQANGVMAMAKKMKTDPRQLAEEVVKNLDVDDICEPPEIAGPGFINLKLKPDFLAEVLLEINTDTDRFCNFRFFIFVKVRIFLFNDGFCAFYRLIKQFF